MNISEIEKLMNAIRENTLWTKRVAYLVHMHTVASISATAANEQDTIACVREYARNVPFSNELNSEIWEEPTTS